MHQVADDSHKPARFKQVIQLKISFIDPKHAPLSTQILKNKMDY